MKNLATRIFAGLMTVLFVISAALQYNDPDPIPWIAIYGAAAIVAGMHVGGRASAKAAWVVAAISLVWALSLFPEFLGKTSPGDLVLTMHAERPEIEFAREAGGLLIVAVTMVVIALAARKQPQNKPSTFVGA